MALSYALAPNPKWYIADLVGRPLGGGSMYTYRSLNKTVQKLIFQDAAGNFPWPDPVLFDENGSQGPFYWEIDSTHTNETYYIEVYDADGVLQWTIDGFLPTGGGGSVVTTAITIKNLVVNNTFWRNVGTVTPLTTTTWLAPGAHSALTYSADVSMSTTCSPDIYLFKNNALATDSVSFPAFTLGSNALTPDVTPTNYLNYTCSLQGAGETFKFVQFPITQGVQNLSNQSAELTIWARGNSGTTTLLLQWWQFFGDGVGASAPVTTPIQTITLTNGWVQYSVTANVPDVSGKTLGDCGNSGLFLQIQFPLTAVCNIDFVKPSVYLGSLIPDQDYLITDDTDAVINSARTGDIKITGNTSFVDTRGWVDLNDGSIGSATSGATTLADIGAFPLFKMLWDDTIQQADVCLVQDSAGSTVARGASAAADFGANNRRITLPKTQGRALASFGLAVPDGSTTWLNAQSGGTQNHTLTIAEMPSHTHPPDTGMVDFNYKNSVGASSWSTQAGIADLVGQTTQTGARGGGTAHNITQSTVFFRVMMKV